MVLLKNEGLLPLPVGSSIALIGPGVSATAIMGGGSATVTPHRSRTILDAFSERWAGQVTHAGGVDLRRGGPSIPDSWIVGDAVTAELFDGEGFDGEPFDVQKKSGVFNWWFGETFPQNVEVLSVRLRLAITAPQGGHYKLSGAGHGTTRLFLDGRLLTDNEVDGFPSGLGLQGGEAEAVLEEGRTYDLVLEQIGRRSIIKAALTDIGAQWLDEGIERQLREAEAVASHADIAVVVVGSNDQWESEEFDRDSIELPAGQDELVRRVLAANRRTVVVLNCGAPMTLPWLDEAPAALLAWYPGVEGADAVLDVLAGEAEPAGRMPTTWAKAERDTPSYLHYPGEAGVVRYGEEIYLGYRWYDVRGVEPLIPFGHGGSYTSFSWGQPSVLGTGTSAKVSVPVRNTGTRTGAEVIQVYVSFQDSPVRRPVKQLAGFAKVWLSAGEQATATVELDEAAFRRWDVATHGWAIDPGIYEIIVAASCADERYRLPFEVRPVDA
jgi:beta-glucosidase